ncbi:hypothetical protein [Parasphingorhabdus cellanae]|uniref:Uncharacterized protein n=1 Tax=Parasphingorhabdus cellanae TaxID=2806553 RepID=A0ABX7T232_9SPHN|nr:hypothetical protein [Parasphingorhabdus cellanae]QTD55008.1 hypothetical protein J4G78_12295 [Parasphingorhabdus cellanae]
MARQDHRIKYARIAVFCRNRGCDLCELWTAQVLEKCRVMCVNFGRFAFPNTAILKGVNFPAALRNIVTQTSYRGEKPSVICVNFGPPLPSLEAPKPLIFKDFHGEVRVHA